MQRLPSVYQSIARAAGAGLLTVALAACSGLPAGIPTAVPVVVALSSFAVTPSTTSAKAGSVTFVVTNTAPEDKHEFVVIKTDLAADKLPVSAEKTVDEAAVTVVDEVEELDPAAIGTLTVNLDAGHYVLICNVAEHYQQGMYVDFTVNP